MCHGWQSKANEGSKSGWRQSSAVVVVVLVVVVVGVVVVVRCSVV